MAIDTEGDGNVAEELHAPAAELDGAGDGCAAAGLSRPFLILSAESKRSRKESLT